MRWFGLWFGRWLWRWFGLRCGFRFGFRRFVLFSGHSGISRIGAFIDQDGAPIDPDIGNIADAPDPRQFVDQRARIAEFARGVQLKEVSGIVAAITKTVRIELETGPGQ